MAKLQSESYAHPEKRFPAQNRFRALVNASAQIVWVTSAEGTVNEDSQAWRDFTGQTVEEFLGHGWLDAIHPEDRETTMLRWRQAVRAQTRYETIYRLRHKTGEWRWTTARGFPVFDERGVIECWVGLNNDVTEQINAKAALEESEMQFRLLAENVPDLVWTADDKAQIYYWNPSWYHYTGQTVAQSLGTSAASVVHEEYRAEALEKWLAAVADESSFEMEMPLRSRNGNYEWFLARARPVRDVRGKVDRWCGVLTNIDAQKRCAAELIEERQNREHFVSSLVHDLKNVIGAGAAALENARQPDLERAEVAVLEQIVANSFSRANQMIGDLLDANAIHAGRRHPLGDWCKFDLADCFSNVVDQSFHRHRERITLRVPRPLEVGWSRKDVVRIFENLVGNAIKYGDSTRPITVEARAVGRDVVWSVHNWGRAIPESERPKLFDFLVRSTESRRGSAGGWGIGLTLVKGLVDAHGGLVKVHTGDDTGTRFEVTMPRFAKEF